MSVFYDVLKDNPGFGTINDSLTRLRAPVGMLGVPFTAKAHIASGLVRAQRRPALCITADDASASRLCDDLRAMGEDAVMYPVKDRNFRTDETRSKEYERQRIGVLGRVAEGACSVVTASIEAAIQLTMPGSFLKEHSVLLRKDTDVPYESVIRSLESAGYTRSELVEGEGQFAVRGSVIDFFPPDSPQPVRAEFFGDTVESLVYFDPVGQRRTEEASDIRITPAGEVICSDAAALADKISGFASGIRGKGSGVIRESLYSDAELYRTGLKPESSERYLSFVYDEPETLFDHCSDMLLLICDSGAVKERFEAVSKLAAEDLKVLVEDGVLCKGLDRFSISWNEVTDIYKKRLTVYIDNFIRGSFDTPTRELVNMNIRQLVPHDGSVAMLKEDLEPDLRQKKTVVILAGTEKAAASLAADLRKDEIPCSLLASAEDSAEAGMVSVLPGMLNYGIEYPGEKVKIMTVGRLSGGGVIVTKRHTRRKKSADVFRSLDDLNKGDLVVHDIYGIGMFEEITTISLHGVKKDYLKIKYRGKDCVYLPVNQLDRLAKYSAPGGEDGAAVRLSRLGTNEWARTKARVKSSVRDMAKELTALYAKRQMTPGFPFSPDIDMQNDFERRFEYEETDDQIRCVYEIKRDMEKPVPMDRLLCGDVGFGKTEVAMRAAFKCVADGKQCVILVPTTILALQHYRTAKRRFEGFPINVDMLSRFRTEKERQNIKKALKIGNIDILIGTHSIIAKDIKFRDPGLVIIDEEQRFGVAQKEKLKAMFPAVDVLTLSATPIPRTLNMSMVGIRDMSVLEDPPQDRSPVQTYVLKHDMTVLAEAIKRELRRGGQVYYLYNRVAGIDDKAREIAEAVPEARIAVGHGKMGEAALSEVWRQLVDNEINVLVCTTIIETGVDVPNVNTLIVENADKMGLSQLHQIRGRVGRSARRAYAYFTYKMDILSEVAERRLGAIREFTEFGSGFRIAMKDLEIRGAGSILGGQQHGHLEAVGYDMYIEILNEAIEEEKLGETTEEVKEKPECVVDIRVDAHIPESYISSPSQRIAAYRRIAAVENVKDADDVYAELRDRYGRIPESVRGLVDIVLIRHAAVKYGIYEIKQNNEAIMLFCKTPEIKLVSDLMDAFPGMVNLKLGDKPYIAIEVKPGTKPLKLLTKAVRALEGEEDA